MTRALLAALLPAAAFAQSTPVEAPVAEFAAPVGVHAAAAPAAALGLGPSIATLKAAAPLALSAVAPRSVAPPVMAAGELAGPPFGALPETIRPDFIEHAGFVEFHELSEEESRGLRTQRRFAGTPIGGGFRVEGVRLFLDSPEFRELRRSAFAESAWAYIPPGRSIRVIRDAGGREHWDYPVGMTFIDSIRARTPGRPIFELRMITRLASGEWAFATYSYAEPSRPAPGEALRRARYAGTPPVEIEFGEEGAVRSVKFMRTNLKSCQACHFANSVAEYQYHRQGTAGTLDLLASRAATGPSGFVPTNAAIRSGWARGYEDRYGRSPFSEVPAGNGVSRRLEIYVDALR